MKRIRLVAVVVLEMITIGLLGAVAGLIGSIPLVVYFFHNPIELTGEAAQVIEQYGWEPYMFMSLSPEVFLNQALVVFVITLVIALYPLYTIYRMNEINALRA
jgi:ABC-type antimicrobial peptide transport system permease subunit